MSSTSGYYFLDSSSQAQGPFTPRQLAEMRQVGLIKSDTLMACQGDTEWLPLSTFEDVLRRPAVACVSVSSSSSSSPVRSLQGLVKAGWILALLGLVFILLGLLAFGGYAVMAGGSTFGLGLVLWLVGRCSQ